MTTIATYESRSRGRRAALSPWRGVVGRTASTPVAISWASRCPFAHPSSQASAKVVAGRDLVGVALPFRPSARSRRRRGQVRSRSRGRRAALSPRLVARQSFCRLGRRFASAILLSPFHRGLCFPRRPSVRCFLLSCREPTIAASAPRLPRVARALAPEPLVVLARFVSPQALDCVVFAERIA